MQQIEPDRLQNRASHPLGPHHRYGATIFREMIVAANRVVVAVAKFFQTIGFCFFGVVPWLVNRLIDHHSGISFREVLASMPVNEREAARGFTWQLTRGVGISSSGAEILKALMGIPAEERAEVVMNVLLLIRPEIGKEGRIKLIEAVMRIPANQRGRVTALVLRVITPLMDWSERCGMLQLVASISPEEREEVVTNGVLLITSIMSYSDRRLLIHDTALVAVNQRGEITNFALSVITPNTSLYFRAIILRTVANVPVEERADVMNHVHQAINDRMEAPDRIMLINNMAHTSADRRADLVQQYRMGEAIDWWDALLAEEDVLVAAERGINVHQGGRDERMEAAIELLRKDQGPISKARLNQAVRKFTKYLRNCEMSSEDKQLAEHALLGPPNPTDFGPFLDEKDITPMRIKISGKEVIGRLWIFASTLTEIEQAMAKWGMVSALKESYYMEGRVCNPGKLQRLIVSVLQGRFEGVNIELIEGMQVSAGPAMTLFFTDEHKAIQQLAPLIEAANRFCDENPLVNRGEFLDKIKEYAETEKYL